MNTVAPAQGRPWRGQSAEQREDDRRRRLLEAGLELFGTAGYSATSVSAVCTAAGVSTKNFYDAFSDREALLCAVYDAQVASTADRLLLALAEAPPQPRAKVEAGLRAVVGHHAEDPRRTRVILLEVVGVSAELDRHRREKIHAFADAIVATYEELVEAGAPPIDDVELVAVGLVGAVNELLLEWLLRDPRGDPADVLTAMTRIVAATMAGETEQQ